MSTSQLGQDMDVLKFYNNKEGGFFVDIGANDGIEFSNTFLLERNYEWKGICAEPNPEVFKLLVKNRPNSLCCDAAIYSLSYKNLLFDVANNYDLMSGLSDHLDVHKEYVNRDKKQIVVKTLTLTDLLDKAKAPSFIDYLSLDTEGSEFEILRATDFSRYTFGLIDVEHNFVEPRRTEIRNLLLSHGYVYLRENQFDDSYKHISL
jgi:FkbM family methyltransferase